MPALPEARTKGTAEEESCAISKEGTGREGMCSSSPFLPPAGRNVDSKARSPTAAFDFQVTLGMGPIHGGAQDAVGYLLAQDSFPPGSLYMRGKVRLCLRCCDLRAFCDTRLNRILASEATNRRVVRASDILSGPGREQSKDRLTVPRQVNERITEKTCE